SILLIWTVTQIFHTVQHTVQRLISRLLAYKNIEDCYIFSVILAAFSVKGTEDLSLNIHWDITKFLIIL
ncbi:MAG: hypothetical protein WB511_06360, partial [Nitrososphaeraceae archaeon]